MRILLTSNYKIGNETGSSHVTDLLARQLSKRNQILYLCLGDKLKTKNVSKSLTVFTIPSVEINGIAIPLITPNTVLKTEQKVSKFMPDIIHTQNSVLISKFIQLWANQKNIPVVTTFHHIPTQAVKHLMPQLPDNLFIKVIEDLYTQTSIKSFLEKINGVIALNKHQANEIKKIDKKIKMQVIQNGLDLSGFKNIKHKSKLKKEINFVFMGSYIERKNQEFLVKTFKYLPENYKLTCYGKISSGKNYYQKIYKDKPTNVELLDFTNDIPKTLENFDFFISTSLKEVQSLSVIYAFAAGLPVIGLENETINELVNSKNGLKLKQKISAKKFADEIIKFVEKSNYKNLSSQAKQDSRKFNIKNVVTKIEKFYKEIV